MAVAFSFLQQTVSIMQAVPEPARLLLVGLSLIWSGAALRKTLRVDRVAESEALSFEQSATIDFRIRDSNTDRELVER